MFDTFFSPDSRQYGRDGRVDAVMLVPNDYDVAFYALNVCFVQITGLTPIYIILPVKNGSESLKKKHRVGLKRSQ